MRKHLSVQISNIQKILLFITAFLLPLIFVAKLTEYYETPKLIFLVVITTLLLILWAVKWVLEGKITLTKSPMDIPLLLMLLVILLSTFFSDSRFVSIFGNLPRIHGSAISWTAYILFFFLAVSLVKTRRVSLILLYILFSSATLLSFITLLSYFGIFPLGNFLTYTKAINFSPSGSIYSTSAILSLLLPICYLFIIHDSKIVHKNLAAILASFFGITLSLIASPAVLIISVVALIYVILSNKKAIQTSSIHILAIPFILSALIFTIANLPIDLKFNLLKQKYSDFGSFREVQLGLPASWKISASSFRDHPFLGTGPSTYIFDFSAYKPIEHNNSRFFNVRFDTASNEFLQVLATLGGFGLVALIFLSLVIIKVAKNSISKDDLLAKGLAISSLVAVLLLFVHTTTLVSIFLTFLILAMLLAASKNHENDSSDEISFGIQASSNLQQSMGPNLIINDLLMIVLVSPVILFAVVVFWNMPNIVLADYYHREALNSIATNNLIATYSNLQKSESNNPKIDVYRIDLAQTNFALANAIATQKAPSETSPGGSLTDQDKKNIQTFISQAIAEGKAATTLSPNNPQNWEILASIYRQISGIAQNALQFSLDAYGRAINRDPLNPILRINVGGVYYSIKNYDLAVRFFNDAASLKPDLANAYYNLSIALREKGDLQTAKATAEKVVSLLDTKSNDYKVASDYLSDLNARIASGSSSQKPITAPAAAENSALQKKELPNVLDDELRDAPENIATPPAIKRSQ